MQTKKQTNKNIFLFFSFFLIIIFFGGCDNKKNSAQLEPTKKNNSADIIDVNKRLIEKTSLQYSDTLDNNDVIYACDDSYLPVLMESIKNAGSSIDIVHFQLNNDKTIFQIINELKNAEKRGVKIRLLAESELKDKTEQSFRKLKDTNFQYKLDMHKRKTHCKMFIFDNSSVLLGSTNLSYKSILHNNETNILIKNSGLANYYTDFFNALWNDSSKDPVLPEFKLTNAEPLVNRMYYPKVTELLTNAKKYIYIYMYGLRFDDRYKENPIKKLLDLIIAAKERGVEVKFMTEKSDYNDTLNKFNDQVTDYLKNNGIEIRHDPINKISHSKLVIVDDTVIIGSSNWGFGAMFQYNEANILLNIQSASEFFKSYFMNLWNEDIE